jgi:hypothetical protein
MLTVFLAMPCFQQAGGIEENLWGGLAVIFALKTNTNRAQNKPKADRGRKKCGDQREPHPPRFEPGPLLLLGRGRNVANQPHSKSRRRDTLLARQKRGAAAAQAAQLHHDIPVIS